MKKFIPMIILVNILQLWKKYKYPVGKVNNYEVNFLNGVITLDDLVIYNWFINCDIFVDKSLNIPVYQSHIKINKKDLYQDY
jgi:hypothetical protein